MRLPFTLAGAALLSTLAAHGQSIDAQKITFDYVRLPLIPLPAGIHNYSPEVVLRYADDVKQQKAAHE
jgi:hypothetical protein